MSSRGKAEAEPTYRISLKDLMDLEEVIRAAVRIPAKYPLKHKIDHPESSYDPLLRESDVIKAVRAWRES